MRRPAPDGCLWLLGGDGWAHPSDLPNIHSFPEAHLEEPPRDTGPSSRGPSAATSTVFPPEEAWCPVPVRPVSEEPQRVRGPASSRNRVPRPRTAAESLTRHLHPVPLAPDRRRDRRAAPRAGQAGRPLAGGGDGVPRGGPYSARSSGRCGTDSRSRSHFSPSRVMSRGSSQSWWGRAARLGPATQQGRAGGATRGFGDPSYALSSLEPTGSSRLGHCGGTTHGRKCCLGGDSALPEAGVGWGGVGCPRRHGDAAPPRGLGRELAAPSGCAPHQEVV